MQASFVSSLPIRICKFAAWCPGSYIVCLPKQYQDDKYDRIWYPVIKDQARKVQPSDTVTIKPYSEEQVPLKIMTGGVTPIQPTWPLYRSWKARSDDASIIYIYLAEVEILESNQKREFNIYYNDIWIGTVSPSSNVTTIRNKIYASSSYNLTLNRTLNSTLPPVINALEIYTLKQLLQNQTDDQDDPCVPQAWVGLNCSYSAQGAARILSLNLSSRGLSGEIATALANLTMIESLDLSLNNLTGNVPKFLARLDKLRILNLRGNNFKSPLPAELLAKSKEGSLWLRFDTYFRAH
ncbi:putative transferase [Helianthus annuus]|uniref:Putative malectin-like carbohydrate-binding domain-containing protein n=1 Tax=Helianthus annuus TaxID=4232 RepID=A0A251VGN8_HELAN|nr:putative transferase [Helianthus annuus]KAJ0604190.1 putative transferase [Helianthus annuus]KAJ0618204.1 putative transferase [Helianthus annuus]KAJ0776666.1 putative transferase [Helianthus annuus]KAJ0804877.1 putative transferase [Helianthus annuus]